MSPLSHSHTFAIPVVLALGSIFAIGGNERSAPNPASEPSSGTVVEQQMSNVNLHLDGSVVLDIRRLRGQLNPTKRGEPVTLDDVNSFTVQIDSAEIAISVKTMTDLLNNYVFAYPGAPLKHIQITAKNGAIKQTGIMHKGVDLPFEIEGPLDVTPEGEIRLH